MMYIIFSFCLCALLLLEGKDRDKVRENTFLPCEVKAGEEFLHLFVVCQPLLLRLGSDVNSATFNKQHINGLVSGLY